MHQLVYIIIFYYFNIKIARDPHREIDGRERI